ncbi:MAG: extracellular solute-binding protein [Campylobacterota bacterium]|nr:extracellular solute-binding protein [Campylobacterota bacterium]
MKNINRSIKVLITLVLILSLFGCSDKSKDSDNKVKGDEKLYKDRVITVIVPNIGNKLVRGPIMEEAKRFEQQTGAIVRVVTPRWLDTINKVKESLVDPKINFDIFVIITSWGGSLFSENHIANVPDWVKDKIQWDDVLPIYKNSILSWDNKSYGLPYDGDCINLYYRKDIFNDKKNKAKFLKEFGYELEAPSTWKKYEDIAKFFNGWDWDNDGKIEYGMVGNRSMGFASILQFFTQAAAYTKHPEDVAFYFDIDTMKPRINNHGFVKALEDYIYIMKYGPKEILNLQIHDIRKSFITGEVAMAIDWSDMGTMAANSEMSIVKDKIGYALLPGYDKVYNSKTNSWDKQLNKPSSIAGNWTILVNKDSKNKKLAFEFASHMTSAKLTKKLTTMGWTGINPSRYSHFNDIDAWADSGFSKNSAKEYLNTISESLNNKNVMVDIRIPGASRYYEQVSKYIDLALRGKMEPKEALDNAALKWDEITDSLDRDKQIELYKKSLNK